jgi:hypothetical protein
MMATPTALCLDLSRASAAAECTCSHGDGGICPMHHSKHTKTTTTSKSDCACRSTEDPSTALLSSLVGGTAVLPDVSRSAVLLGSSAVYPVSVLQPRSPFVVPDGPPPRS